MPKLLAAFLAIGLLAVAAWPAQPEEAVIPEFLVGTLGGYVGGIGGAYVLAWLFASGARTLGEALGYGILGAILGFTGGTILGASLGVIGTGWVLGIEGNVELCFWGATAGTGLAFGLGMAFNWGEIGVFLVSPVAAAGATAGFNVGARPRR